MRRKLILQPFCIKQYFHDVKSNAAAISALLCGNIAPIKRIKDMLELLFSQWFAGVFDGQLMLVAGDCYHAPGVAVAYRI